MAGNPGNVQSLHSSDNFLPACSGIKTLTSQPVGIRGQGVEIIGSGLGKSAAGLQSSTSGARILNGRMLNGRLNEAELRSWVEGLKL